MDQTDSVSIHYTDEEYLLSGQNYSNLYSMFSLFNYSVVCTLKIIYIYMYRYNTLNDRAPSYISSTYI